MAHSEKVTITLDPQLLDKVDRTRRATGTTRSGFVAHAVSVYLSKAEEQTHEELWARSYETNPQQLSTDSVDLLDNLASENW